MKVSILMLTLDRYEQTKQVLEHNLKNCGHDDYELLVADNGSTDQRVVELVKEMRTAYHRINKKNEGVARAFNQLILRAKGELICLMGNDILNPDGWLDELVKYAKAVPKCGIVGIECTTPVPTIEERNGIIAHYCRHDQGEHKDKVFGTMLFSREVLETVGGFCEEFHPYGLEDSDYNNRVNLAGFQSLYVPVRKSQHIGNDVGEKSEYRKMKDDSLHRNHEIYMRRCKEYPEAGFYEPLPKRRGQLK